MRIFIDEFLTGGGLLSSLSAPVPQGLLLTEGLAMVRAVAADFLAIPNLSVLTMRDARLSPLHPPGCEVVVVHSAADELAQCQRLAAAADWTLLIAPESDGALLQRARLVESAGGRLLSPAAALIEITANKQLTADWLRRHEVPAPDGTIIHHGDPPTAIPFPAVIKPPDGCGSQDVRLIRDRAELASALLAQSRPLRIEPFVPGLPASVAVLCGTRQQIALPACLQRLSSDGHFTYLGGRTPLATDLDRRARRLALAAIATLPQPLGYLGVDLVLGDDPLGGGDIVIEINPRLTTSYVGLRAACRENLAAAMLALAMGRPATLSFHDLPVEFDADGTLRGTSPT